MIGRTVGAATVATIQGMIVLAMSLCFGFRPVSWGAVPAAVLIMFLVALIFSSIGTIIGSLLDDMQAFSLIINFLVQPMFFLSGALFTLRGCRRGWRSFQKLTRSRTALTACACSSLTLATTTSASAQTCSCSAACPFFSCGSAGTSLKKFRLNV